MEDNLEEETLKKDEETPIVGSQIKIIAPLEGGQIETKDLIKGRICEENEKDPLVHDLEKKEKAPIFGQLKISLLFFLTTKNFSSLSSTYFYGVVETNIFGDLKMQDLLEKNYFLQDPSIVLYGDKIKISSSFEVHPPRGKIKNNVNDIVRKLRMCSALDVKSALGDPPD